MHFQSRFINTQIKTAFKSQQIQQIGRALNIDKQVNLIRSLGSIQKDWTARYDNLVLANHIANKGWHIHNNIFAEGVEACIDTAGYIQPGQIETGLHLQHAGKSWYRYATDLGWS